MNNYQEMDSRIMQGLPVELQFYKSGPLTHSALRSAVETLCVRYNRPELIDTLYSCIRELVNYATSANLKRAFFQKEHLDINNMGHYVRGITRYHNVMENSSCSIYGSELENMDLWVRVQVRHSNDGFTIEVENNSPISEMEQGQLRMQLKRAMKTEDDLLTFYSADTDFYGEAPMGLTMLVLMLKNASLDAGLFRIGSKGSTTTARLELPLSGRYKSMRTRTVH